MDPPDGVALAPGIADGDFVGGCVVADDHADVVVAFGLQVGEVALCFARDLGGIGGPVFDVTAFHGALVGNHVVGREAAHLPEEGDAFVDILFDFGRRERAELQFAGGAAAFASGGEGDFVVEFPGVGSSSACSGERGEEIHVGGDSGVAHGAFEGGGCAVSFRALVDHRDVVDKGVTVFSRDDIALKAFAHITIANSFVFAFVVGEEGFGDTEADVFLFDVSKEERVIEPIPALGFVGLVPLAKDALFGGLAEDGGEVFGDGAGIEDHRPVQGVTIDTFAIFFEVILAGADGAQAVSLIGIDEGKGFRFSGFISVSYHRLGLGPGEFVSRPGVEAVAAGERRG